MLNKWQLKSPPFIISIHTDIKEYIASKKSPSKVYPRAIFCCPDQIQYTINSLDFFPAVPNRGQGWRELQRWEDRQHFRS